MADEEVDEGADLLVVGELAVGVSTPAAVLAAAMTGREPVAVVGRGSGIDDRAWMVKAAAVRDGLRRTRAVGRDPQGLLRVAGGADLAALVGFLAQAARRRTPVVLDGAATAVAALLADTEVPGARAWWAAGTRCTEPAQALRPRPPGPRAAAGPVDARRPGHRGAGGGGAGARRGVRGWRDRGPLRGGVTLAVAMFTVVPLRARRIDRAAAAVALAVVPVVGVVLGPGWARWRRAWSPPGRRGCSPGSWRSGSGRRRPGACTSTGSRTSPTGSAATATRRARWP